MRSRELLWMSRAAFTGILDWGCTGFLASQRSTAQWQCAKLRERLPMLRPGFLGRRLQVEEADFAEDADDRTAYLRHLRHLRIALPIVVSLDSGRYSAGDGDECNTGNMGKESRKAESTKTRKRRQTRDRPPVAAPPFFAFSAFRVFAIRFVQGAVWSRVRVLPSFRFPLVRTSHVGIGKDTWAS
jgi:hypothetical protein